jgi:V/A-type H+-transporting ATPase subunit I
MAVLFGFLYGSIFGVEHWLHPWWIAPMSDPMYMLGVAFAWGVGFLTLGGIILIYNRLVVGDLIGALFDPGGVFSLMFYFAALWGVASLLTDGYWPWAASALIVPALGLLMAYQWHEVEAPFGERLLTVLIETYEIVSGYVSGSLSFLRVAAFSLNHVALSVAVFTLADMSDGVGHWITIIIGNLFVMLLEGLIVFIQTLRLEYYEGFSRYFYADGTRYTPLRTRKRATSSSSSKSLHHEASS